MPLIAPSQADAVVSIFIEEEIELAFYGACFGCRIRSFVVSYHRC